MELTSFAQKIITRNSPTLKSRSDTSFHYCFLTFWLWPWPLTFVFGVWHRPAMSDGRMTEECWLYLLTPQVFVQHVSGLVGVPQTPISCPSLPSHRGSATAGGSSTTRRQTVLTVSSSDVPPTRPNNLTASPYTRVSTAGWLRGSLLSGHASLVLRPHPIITCRLRGNMCCQ